MNWQLRLLLGITFEIIQYQRAGNPVVITSSIFLQLSHATKTKSHAVIISHSFDR